MGNASTLNAKSGILASASYCSCWPTPRYQGPEKSKNHRHELGEILISLGRDRAIFRGFCGLVTRDLQDAGPVRAQVDYHPARLRSRCGTIQGSRGSRIALSVSD